MKKLQKIKKEGSVKTKPSRGNESITLSLPICQGRNFKCQ